MISSTLSLLLVGTLLTPGAIQSQATTESGTIVTVGRADVEVPTDYLTLTVGVLIRSRSPVEAADSALIIMAAVADTLAAYHLPGDSLENRSFQVEPDVAWGPAGRQITGYLARGTYTVEVRDLRSVRGLITACLGGGATEVKHLKPLSDAQERLREAMLMAAVEASRRLADSMATAAGGTVGDLIRLETDDVDSWRWSGLELGMVFLEQAPGVELAPPTLTIRASVKGTWTFLSNPAR